MQVNLNGNTYVLRAGTTVTRTPIVEWPDNIRTDGQQYRKDRRLLSSWEINDVSGGLGKKEQESGGNRLWDVENVDTRYPGQKILSPALVTCAVTPSYGKSDGMMFDWQGQIHLTHTTGSIMYQFTPPSSFGSYLAWGLGTTNAIKVAGDKIVLIANNGYIYYYYGVASGSVGTSTGLNIGSLSSINPQISDVGGTVHVLHWDANTNSYSFFIAPRLPSGSLGPVATLPGTVGSYLAPMFSNGQDVYAITPQGIYDFDSTPAIVVDSARAQDRNPQQVFFNQYLHFKNKKSFMRWDGTTITSIGYDREDGLPSDKMGEITALCSTWQNVFAAVKGATYSHILSYDGAWQYYARWPSTGIWIREMFLSDSPDAIDRLWCIPGNDPNIGYFLNPMCNPLQAGTYSYVPSGHYTLPIYGGGLSEEFAGWYRTIVTANPLGSGVTIHYGLEGGAVGSLLGVVGSTHTALLFGSPNGIEAYRLQPKITLALGVTSPVVNSVLVQYLKDPTKRHTFDFEIDVDATQDAYARDSEAILGSLAYETNLKTLMPFQYGQIATTYVKVIDAPSSEVLPDPRFLPEDRSGFVRVRVVEIVV